MNQLTIETFVLGQLETNCYLLSSGREAVVIDVGEEPRRLIDRIEEGGYDLKGIYLTHFHLDHIGGVAEFLERCPVPVYGSPKDDFLRDIPLNKGGIREVAEFVSFPYQPIEQGRFTVLGQAMMALPTPGHTPGSLSYFFPAAGCAFVGDLIFMIGVGRTDRPRGSSEELLNSIRSRIFILPGETRIYPGHGPMTSVKHEKKNNPHFMV